MKNRKSNLPAAILSVSMVLLTATPVFAGEGVWTISGPNWANSLIVEVNPADNDNVYATGANPVSGLFVSSDGASTWALANNGLEMDTGNGKRISAFTLDETDASYQFCAVTDDAIGNEDYLFRSTDSGLLWTRILESEGPLNVNLSCIDSHNGTVYIGAGNTLYKSTDYGASFSETFTFGNDIRSLALDPDDPTTVYVAASGVYKSTDGGVSFNISGFQGSFIIYIGVHKVDSDKYITASLYGGDLHISSDGGETWLLRNNGLPGSLYDLAYSPNTPNTIYAAVVFGGVYKTADGGLNWINTQSDIENPYGGGLGEMLGTNITCYDNGDTDTVYISSNWGVHKSSNGGTNWESVGVPAQSIYAMDFTGANPYTGFAGSGIGVFSFTDQSWDETGLMSEIGSYITAAAIDPDNNQVVLVGRKDANNYAYIGKSTDGGENWTWPYNGMGSESGTIAAIEFKPTDPMTIYATMFITGGYTDGGLLISTDGGDSFTQNPYFDDIPLTDFVFSESNPDIIYISGYNGEVWVSEDGGSSWTMKTNTGIINRAIAVSPDDPLQIIAGGQDETEALYFSDDGGSTWNPGGYGGGLIKGIEYVDNSIVLAAYGDGVFHGTGNGTWTALDNGLGSLRVNNIWTNDNGPVTIYAGTSGSGVYHIELSELGMEGSSPDPGTPSGFALYQSYPNPTNGSATIAFNLPETTNVRLDVYDITGRKVSSLALETLNQGMYERSVSGLSSGVYLYRLETDTFSTTRKLVVR